MLTLRRAPRTLLIAATALPLFACQPSNGPPTATDIRSERAQAMQLVEQLRAKDGIYEDAAAQAYLERILAKVDAQRPRGSAPLTGYIVKDADVNAFTTGGGVIFVNAGMLAAMENEAQIAMVISHEVAHVDRGHIRAGRDTRTAVGIGGVVAAIGLTALGVDGSIINPVVGYGQQAAVAGFTRTQETDADDTGFVYLTGAGWDPVEGARSFEVLRRLYGDASGPAAFFASHPATTDRQAKLQAMARAGRLGR